MFSLWVNNRLHLLLAEVPQALNAALVPAVPYTANTEVLNSVQWCNSDCVQFVRFG